MVVWLIPIIVFLLCATGEWLHARRTKRLAYLAFGPSGRARGWVRFVPVLRTIAMTSLCWGLIILLRAGIDDLLPGRSTMQPPAHHLVVALDVSPSMLLTDSGPDGKQSRAERARQVLRSILDRTDLQATRVSVIAFYTKALPIVIDTFDPEVVANILGDLPLEHAFKPGKTDIYATLNAASEIAKKWRPRSATFVIVSDGDTLPATKTPSLPAAFANSLVIGVGNPYQGMPIDGHSSRQDSRSLEQLALRIHGSYANANARHITTDTLSRMAAGMDRVEKHDVHLIDLAILSVLLGAVTLALVAPALALAGSGFVPARVRQFETLDLGLRLPSSSHNNGAASQQNGAAAKPSLPASAGIGGSQ